MPVRDRNEIFQRLRAHAAEMRALGVLRLGLFGSFLNQHQRADSDVDLVVELSDEARTFDRFLALADRLEGILERRVDLLTPESLDSPLGRLIHTGVENVPLGA